MNEIEHNLPTPFSDQERLAFQTLRARYEEDHDRFTERERARLRFLRWLHEAGRLDFQSGYDDLRSGDSIDCVENPPEADRDLT
jgi:hypothetical protein